MNLFENKITISLLITFTLSNREFVLTLDKDRFVYISVKMNMFTVGGN